MKAILISVVLCWSHAVSAFDYKLLVNTPRQSTGNTCQSFSIAVALSLIDTTGRYSINTPADLWQAEYAIRKKILDLAQLDSPKTSRNKLVSNRVNHWKPAIEEYTSGEYTLIIKDFRSIERLEKYLLKNAAIKQKKGSDLIYFVSSPITAYLLSFKEIENDPFASGHIVSVIGAVSRKSDIVGPNNTTQTRPSIAAPPEYLIVNSADRNNYCTSRRNYGPLKNLGYTNWIKNYTYKVWPDKRIYMIYLKKTARKSKTPR